MDLGLEAAFEVLACPDSLAMDRIAAREAVISHFQAQQMLDMREVSLDQPPEDYRGNTFSPAAAEIASALCWTTGATLGKIELARELLLGLPEVFEALRLRPDRPDEGQGNRRTHSQA